MEEGDGGSGWKKVMEEGDGQYSAVVVGLSASTLSIHLNL